MAAALGAIIGYQRERAGKPAGLRTIVLVCVGAAIFTIASIYGFGAVALLFIDLAEHVEGFGIKISPPQPASCHS